MAGAIAPARGAAPWQRGFLIGAATSAFQIEGATGEDGRLPSIWDTFCALPGRIRGGDDGDVACDHYHRAAADVALLAELGVDAYRFSIAWPRVMTADGRPNERGLAFYARLIDALQARGIRAFPTLYHWDLPQHLQDRGGWMARETAQRFADYADLASRRFAGRVAAWTTLNEPWCAAWLGHGEGVHAPGVKRPQAAVDAMHHLLLGHGLGVAAIRANDAAPVGLATNVTQVTPATGSAADRQAAALAATHANHWVLDPLLEGRYPALLAQALPGTTPPAAPGDAAIMSTPLDFLGLNYYTRRVVADDGAGGWRDIRRPGVERSQMDWEVWPAGLRDLLLACRARHPALPPILVTENGYAGDDSLKAGRVHDAARIRYLARHLDALDEAVRQGVDVRGWFAWSLLDNFEWAEGYRPRFGLVHVDYATQRRTLKDSALALRDFLARRRLRCPSAGAGWPPPRAARS